MELGLRGRSVGLTGAFGGLGRAIGLALLAEGAHLVAGDLQGEEEGLALARSTFGAEAVFRRCDLGDAGSTLAFAEAGLDILVANAGVTHSCPTLDLGIGELERVVGVNLVGNARLIQAAARSMVARGAGAIVVLGSWVQDIPLPSTAAYTASKAALAMFVRNLALEIAPTGVRLNLVAPGTIDAGMAGEQMRRESARRTRALQRTPMGRLGTPEEVADAVCFLCSDRAGFITGASLLVDGGASLGSLRLDPCPAPS